MSSIIDDEPKTIYSLCAVLKSALLKENTYDWIYIALWIVGHLVSTFQVCLPCLSINISFTEAPHLLEKLLCL